MQIDIDYLKMILDKFVESETQYIETSIFDKIMEDEEFLFHWDILLDKKIILNLQGNVGKFYSRTNNNIIFNYTNVRLNDNGYHFYEALKDNNFRNKIKKDLTNISIETLELVAKKFIDNKIDKFF